MGFATAEILEDMRKRWIEAQATIAAQAQRIERLEGLLKPFADAVHFETGNPDACDSFPDHVTDEQWLAVADYAALAPPSQQGTHGKVD